MGDSKPFATDTSQRSITRWRARQFEFDQLMLAVLHAPWDATVDDSGVGSHAGSSPSLYATPRVEG